MFSTVERKVAQEYGIQLWKDNGRGGQCLDRRSIRAGVDRALRQIINELFATGMSPAERKALMDDKTALVSIYNLGGIK